MSTEIRSAREAMTIFKILGIKDVTTERQRKNGTQVFELPIQQMWQTLQPKPMRFATYKSGYVRNVTEGLASSYQINKTTQYPSTNKIVNGHYYGYKERILIPSWEERLIYLAKFIIKNYYKKPTYVMNEYTIECLKEAYYEQNKTVKLSTIPLKSVIINGHRYNLS